MSEKSEDHPQRYGEMRGDPYAAYRDKNKMLGMYVEQDLSVDDIAEKIGCRTDTVLNWLDEHEIEREPPARDSSAPQQSEPDHDS